MISLNGVKLEVGMKVYLLQVPVQGDHKFKIGTVEKITDKTVHVNYEREERYRRGAEAVSATVKRYPQQLITVTE